MNVDAARWIPFAREVNRATMHNVNARVLASVTTPDDAVRWIRRYLPYRYVPSRRVVDVRRALSRGDAACGEAAAIVASVVLRAASNVGFCLELIAEKPGYAHVTVTSDRDSWDAYADAALRTAEGCTYRWGIDRRGMFLRHL